MPKTNNDSKNISVEKKTSIGKEVSKSAKGEKFCGGGKKK